MRQNLHEGLWLSGVVLLVLFQEISVADQQPLDLSRIQALASEVLKVFKTGSIAGLVVWTMQRLKDPKATFEDKHLSLSVACRFGVPTVPSLSMLQVFMNALYAELDKDPDLYAQTIPLMERAATAVTTQISMEALQKNVAVAAMFRCVYGEHPMPDDLTPSTSTSQTLH